MTVIIADAKDGTNMKEVCIPEKDIPKNCGDCFMRTSSNNCAASKVPHFSVNDKKYMECRHRGCPIKSIEQHDNQALRRFLITEYRKTAHQDEGKVE